MIGLSKVKQATFAFSRLFALTSIFLGYFYSCNCIITFRSYTTASSDINASSISNSTILSVYVTNRTHAGLFLACTCM